MRLNKTSKIDNYNIFNKKKLPIFEKNIDETKCKKNIHLLINFTVNDQLGIKIERCSMTALVVNVVKTTLVMIPNN